MVPKILHYCWFGPRPLPPAYAAYIDGWRQVMPDYTVVEWNDYTLPLVPYVEKAYKYGKWANLANYMRFYALAKLGGIYLDTDIEVIRSFDHLLDNGMFAGWQSNGQVNNAVLGARPAHPFILRCLNDMSTLFDGTERATLSSPHLMTCKLAAIYNITTEQHFDNLVEVKGARIYPSRYFYPYWLGETFERDVHVVEDTVCVHHWAATWTRGQPIFNGDRVQLLAAMPSGLRWAEIGVARGNFSAQILEHAAPAKLVLVDLWHQQPVDVYDDKANVDNVMQEKIYNYVLSRFADARADGRVCVQRISSTEALRAMPPASLDCIYLDANHAYGATLCDLQLAHRVVGDGGLILGHDYCGGDDAGCVFGVMAAVSEFLSTRTQLRLAAITNEQFASYVIARTEHPVIGALKSQLR